MFNRLITTKPWLYFTCPHGLKLEQGEWCGACAKITIGKEWGVKKVTKK